MGWIYPLRDGSHMSESCQQQFVVCSKSGIGQLFGIHGHAVCNRICHFIKTADPQIRSHASHSFSGFCRRILLFPLTLSAFYNSSHRIRSGSSLCRHLSWGLCHLWRIRSFQLWRQHHSREPGFSIYQSHPGFHPYTKLYNSGRKVYRSPVCVISSDIFRDFYQPVSDDAVAPVITIG